MKQSTSVLVLLAILAWPFGLQSGFKGDGRISFYNLHLNEMITAEYRHEDGSYDTTMFKEIEHALRCRMTDHSESFPPELIELVDNIQDHFGVPVVHIISGYRSPELNQHLKSIGRAVAGKSLHMQALAMDIRLPGIDVDLVRDYAKSLHKGGVGYYPSNNFVHVDVGPVRYW